MARVGPEVPLALLRFVPRSILAPTLRPPIPRPLSGRSGVGPLRGAGWVRCTRSRRARVPRPTGVRFVRSALIRSVRRPWPPPIRRRRLLPGLVVPGLVRWATTLGCSRFRASVPATLMTADAAAVAPRPVARGWLAARRARRLRAARLLLAVAALLASVRAGPRVAMVATRSPIFAPRLIRRSAMKAGGIRRVPQPTVREPLQLDVLVRVAQLPQRRQQIVAPVGTEGRRRLVDEDRPVREAWRHAPEHSTRRSTATAGETRGAAGSGAITELTVEAFQLFDEGRSLEVEEPRGLPFVAAGAFE